MINDKRSNLSMLLASESRYPQRNLNAENKNRFWSIAVECIFWGWKTTRKNDFTRNIGAISLALMLNSLSVNAGPIAIDYLSVFINSTDLGTNSSEHTQIGTNGFTDIEDAGLTVSFNNQLNSDSLGRFSWRIQNTTGRELSNMSFFVFLDVELDEPLNTFFNELGELVDVSGSGVNDVLPDSWEIDEPKFVFGDIIDNLLSGQLDNINAVPPGSEDDVSLTLGFEIGDLLADETLLGIFEISETNIGGLRQTDPDSNFTFYFNGTAQVQTASVPNPSTLSLMILTLIMSYIRNFETNFGGRRR